MTAESALSYHQINEFLPPPTVAMVTRRSGWRSKMLDHADVWRAIDEIARESGLSPSGLARRAGLDATTFNRSKRFSPDGKPRWPSTESLAKVLDATGCSLTHWVELIQNTGASNEATNSMPMFRLSEMTNLVALQMAAHELDLKSIGRQPRRYDWRVELARKPDDCFALEIDHDGFEPFYSRGNILILSGKTTPTHGDRVVLRTLDGVLYLGRFEKPNGEFYQIGLLGSHLRSEIRLVRGDLAWVAPILWSQQISMGGQSGLVIDTIPRAS